MVEDEPLLMALLNSTPVVDDLPTDELEGARGAEAARRLGGSGDDREIAVLRRARAALQAAVRGRDTDTDAAIDELAALLRDAVRIPRITSGGVRWELHAPADHELAVRAVLAWSAVVERHPGRLRPCANDECHLFLLDHSRPGTARWCSMATCGNRMKARAHASRRRS